MCVGSVRVYTLSWGNITFVEVNNTRKEEPGGRWREINNVCHKKKRRRKNMWRTGRFSPQTPRGILTRTHTRTRARAYPKDPIKTTPSPRTIVRTR